MKNRIFLSIKNRPLRSILFVALFFVLSLFLCASLLIYRLYSQGRKELVSTLNIQVVLVNEGLKLENLNELESMDEMRNRINQTFFMMDDLSSLEYVKYGDINYKLINSNFMPSCRVDEKGIECVTISESEYDSTIEKFKSLLEKREINSSYLGGNITSVKEPDWTQHVKGNASFGIDSGSRIFTQEEMDSGALVAIVDKDLAFVNENEVRKIEVGDLIPITIIIRDEEDFICYNPVELEVIGIIDERHNISLDWPIYIPEKTWVQLVKEMRETVNENCDGFYDRDEFFIFLEISDAYFELASFDDLDDFTSRIQLYQEEMGKLEYYTNVDQIYPFVSDIKLIESQFLFLSGFILIASVILYSSLMRLEQIYRKKEMQILSALGERRKNISAQMLLEYLILGYLGFILAGIVLSLISSKIDFLFTPVQIENMSDILNQISIPNQIQFTMIDWALLAVCQFLILTGSFALASIRKNIHTQKEEG